METKHIFLFASAETCGHCVNFRKNHFENLKERLGKECNVELVDMKLKKMGDIDPNYPKDLQRFVQWYPTFMLISESSWNRAKKSKDEKLDGIVFNAEPMTSNTSIAVLSNTRQNPTPDILIKWINDNKSSELFSGGKKLGSMAETKKEEPVRLIKPRGNIQNTMKYDVNTCGPFRLKG